MAILETGNACEFRLVPRLTVLTPSQDRKQYTNNCWPASTPH